MINNMKTSYILITVPQVHQTYPCILQAQTLLTLSVSLVRLYSDGPKVTFGNNKKNIFSSDKCSGTKNFIIRLHCQRWHNLN